MGALFFRALLAFLALPVPVAFVAPHLLLPLDSHRAAGTAAGWPVCAAGLLILLACVREFHVSGQGTLAPWDPPRKMVTGGLYCYSRNPMYVGVVAIVAGQALGFGSPLLGVYAVALTAAFHVRVVRSEEPRMTRQFPEEWRAYSRGVDRWLPLHFTEIRKSKRARMMKRCSQSLSSTMSSAVSGASTPGSRCE